MIERSLFLAALEIEDSVDRLAYLDEACRDDQALRRRVDDLLAAHLQSQNFMNEPVVGAAFEPSSGWTGLPPATDMIPSVTGMLLADRYLVGEEIGRGGMGTVYRAEQLRPIRRSVAVKLINPGMDSRQVLTRFEAERQALAVMDHPQIAKVLDAGATPEGRPFFVMELVQGVPLTDYCDAHRLPMAERLDLFRQVCGAVQHAHQKGVIHRDIKPSNILVEEHDGVPTPKVIDFGLAKAIGEATLTDETLVTVPGSVAGTPLYMAPEQAGPESQDVDTRADVYSLGAVLYELLTGSPPIERETLRRAALHEVLRVIREDDPQPPSSRIGSSDSLPTVAVNRGTEPARLGRFVSGDLDWVAMKALEKDRSRRYVSAAALADDIERFLNHEPVAAGPPTLRYRASKFVRRNRTIVAAAMVVLVCLVGGIIGTSLGLFEARRQRDAANRARLAESEQRKAAVEEVDNAAAVRDFLLEDLLLQSAPYLQSGPDVPDKDVKVRTLLDRAATHLPGPFLGRPLLEGSIRSAIGQSYLHLGEYDQAATHLAIATELLTKTRGPGHAETLRAGLKLADVDTERGEFPAAQKRLTSVLKTARESPGLAPEVLAEILVNLTKLALNQKQIAQAETLLTELGEVVARLGVETRIAIEFDYLRSFKLFLMGRYDDSAALATEAHSRCRKILGDENPMSTLLLGQVAMCLSRQGKHDLAAVRWRELADLTAKVNGADHSATLLARFNLARALQDGSQFSEAETTYRQIVSAYERLRGPDHFETIGTLGYLAETVRAGGRFAEAEPLYERVRRAQRTRYGPGTRGEAFNGSGQAACLIRIGRYSEAEPLLRDSLAIYEKSEPGGWRAALVRSRLGAALAGQRKWAEAEPLLVSGYSGLRDRRLSVPLASFTPDDRAAAAETVDRLVELAETLGRPEDVKKWQAERSKYPPVARPTTP